MDHIVRNITSLTRVRVWLYTPDTRCDNPEFQDPRNDELADISADVEQSYTWIYQELNRYASVVDRRYHPWGDDGEITIGESGWPVFQPDV